jgi:multiple sugar transport system substrate-binding protein
MADHRLASSGTAVRRRQLLLRCGGIALGAVALSACGRSVPSGATAAGASASSAAPPASASATTSASAAASTAASSVPVATTAATAASSAVPASAGAVATGATVKQPVEIQFNTWWPSMPDAFPSLQKQFQDANPGVAVTMSLLTYAEYADKMTTGLVGGGFGDAAQVLNTVQTKLMSSGHHYDLTSWANEDKLDLRGNYGLSGLEIWCGKVLCMPFDNDTRAVQYNKTMIRDAGAKDPWDDLHGKWTWDDALEIAQKCTKRDSGGKTTQFGLQVPFDSVYEIESLFWSLGGNYADWQTGKWTFADPAVVKVEETLHKWMTVDQVMLPASTKGLPIEPNENAFQSGLVALYMRASADVAANLKYIGNKFEWDVAPLPAPGSLAPGKPGAANATGNPHFVPAPAKQPHWGYKWLAFLAGPAMQDYLARHKTTMVAYKGSWKTYQDSPPPAHPGSLVYYVYSRPYGYHYYSDFTSKALGFFSSEIDKAFAGQQTIGQALQSAQSQANALGPAQSAPCGANPYGDNVSPRPALAAAELARSGVHPY